MTVFSLCGVVITFSSIKQIPTPEGLRAERVVGADPCVCPEMLLVLARSPDLASTGESREFRYILNPPIRISLF